MSQMEKQNSRKNYHNKKKKKYKRKKNLHKNLIKKINSIKINLNRKKSRN